ncbi:hypothetical protein ACFSHQ_05595 [Gemmobacter lanyuensis]
MTFLALSLIFLVFLLLTGIAAQVVGMIPVLGLWRKSRSTGSPPCLAFPF